MKPQGTVCKIGKQEHIDSLHETVIVFMNTLDTFWRIEDGGLRGDHLDGVEHMANGKRAELRTAAGKLIPANVTSWTLQTRTAEPEKINLFCMYALRWDPDAPLIDKRVIEFGDTAIIFTNPNEFQNRIYAAVRETGRRIEANLVTYVPNNYVGEIGLFRKTELFAFQSEWRLACFDGPGHPITFEIGCLKDISRVIPTCELKCFLTSTK